MIGSDVCRMILAVALALWHGAPTAVYAVAFAMSVGGVFFNPAASSVLPALVRKEALVAANSGIWTAAVLSQIMLAPLAGVLVVTVGYGPAFLINAGSHALSAMVLRGLRIPALPGPSRRRRLWTDAREVVLLLGRHPLLRALAAGQLLAALSAGATSALVVVLAEEHLNVTGGGYGLLIGAIGIGAALGPVALLRLVHDPARPVFVFGPFGLRGLVDLVLATFSAVPVAVASLVVYGVGTLQLDAASRDARAGTGSDLRVDGRALAGRPAALDRGRRCPGGSLRHRGRLLPRWSSAGRCCRRRPSDEIDACAVIRTSPLWRWRTVGTRTSMSV